MQGHGTQLGILAAELGMHPVRRLPTVRHARIHAVAVRRPGRPSRGRPGRANKGDQSSSASPVATDVAG
eukprot:15441487-Alexandrium_andersonii.AAC.1